MKRVAIIGAGLAGAACAYVLKQRGFEPVIYEERAEIASGASGNALGLYNPRLSAEKTIYTDAFEMALDVFANLKNIGWKQCGSLHLIADDKKEKRFAECVKNLGWADMEILDAHKASDIAGVEIDKDALWLPRSGVVSPKKLCEAYANDIEIHFNQDIKTLSDVEGDFIILANGMAAKKFMELPLKAVRGQITYLKPNAKSVKVKCNLCYGGYLTPVVDGVQAVGSTFQRWLDHTDIIPADNEDNIEKLKAAVPAMVGEYEIAGQRAGVRTTTDDHFPIYGPVKGYDKLYVSTAHGSHGIITSILAANAIADDIAGKP